MRLRSLLSTFWLVAAIVSFTDVAFAHPGHGNGLVAGISHPFTGLDHLLAMVAVGLWASQLGRQAIWMLPAVFPVMMAAGFVGGVDGVTLPWAELGVLVSVVVLGAAVALGAQASIAASVVLVGVFAIFHGFAHGREIPADAWPLLYLFGFVAATVTLHATGIAIGLLARRPLLMRAAGGAIAAAGLLLFVA